MITITENNSLSSKNHIKENQAINSLVYQENGQITQQEKLQITTEQVNLTYSSESITTYNRSMSLDTNTGDGFDLLRGLVLNIFKGQGLDYTIAADDTKINVRTIAPDEAQERIADDGYFGVEKTSDRIFKFAVGMAGGDPTSIDAIREGVENGFRVALDAFGGWLPEISYDTYDTVMKKLDDWAGVDNSPQSQA
ncbi:MAG: hypothetical protein GQ541_04160 [Desulfovibrionaceae bacterium]|nr:hypothetical protein [Desulfovibrionaceae bacterium]